MQQRFLLQILLLAQHVSGTTMPIIRSSRVLYSGCCLRYFVLWFSSCWSGVKLRVMCHYHNFSKAPKKNCFHGTFKLLLYSNIGTKCNSLTQQFISISTTIDTWATCFDSYRVTFRPSKNIDPIRKVVKCT